MRVGLMVYGGLEAISGGFLYDRYLIEHLSARGDQAEVIALPWHSYVLSFGENFSSDILAKVLSLNLDVLIEDELSHPSLLLLNRRIRARTRLPIIGIIHHLRCSEARPRWQNALYRWVEDRYLRTLDGCVYNSETTRKVVEELIGSTRPGVVAYPAGDRLGGDITSDEINHRAHAAGPLRVCFAGNVIPRKGLDSLIAGLARLRSIDWTLAVAGSLTVDPAYAMKIREQIARSGFKDRIQLHGSLDAASLANLFSNSHVLAVPSSYEGFGIVYVEAMSFGLPAIATTAGAAGEIIDHGNTGFLVLPGYSQEIADHLMELGENRDRLAAMGNAARVRYCRHPTWQQSMRLIREYLVRVSLDS